MPVTETSLGGQHPGPPLPGTPVGGERKSTIPGPGPIDSVLEQPEGAAGVPVPETSLRGQHQGPAPGGQTLDHKGLAPRVQPAHGRFGCYGRAALQHFHRVAIGQSCPTVGKKYVPKLPRPSRAKPRRRRAVAKLLAKSGFGARYVSQCFAVAKKEASVRLSPLSPCVSETWLGALVCCRPEEMQPQIPTWRSRPGCVFHVSPRFRVCGCVCGQALGRLKILPPVMARSCETGVCVCGQARTNVFLAG